MSEYGSKQGIEAVRRAAGAWGDDVDLERASSIPLAGGFLCSYAEQGVRGHPLVFVPLDGDVRVFPTSFTRERIERVLAGLEPDVETSSLEGSDQHGRLSAEQEAWLQEVVSGDWRTRSGRPPLPPQ